MLVLPFLAAVPLLLLNTASALSIQPRQQVCNGHAELCNKKYSDVVFIGAHDSYAVADGNPPGTNQNKDVTSQLNDGIRLLEIQGHAEGDASDSNPSGISLCHTSCLLFNGGTLEDYLQKVVDWLNSNPNEVLTLLPTNPDHLDVAQWAKGFAHVGLDTLAYVPSSNPVARGDWPTLGELISSKRVIIFMDYTTDLAKAPYILPEFDNIWENPYDQTDLPFACNVDRGAPADNKMFLQNEAIDFKVGSLTVPDGSRTAEVNSASGDNGIPASVERCAATTGNRATFVLVDYYDVPGDNGVFAAAAQLNGL